MSFSTTETDYDCAKSEYNRSLVSHLIHRWIDRRFGNVRYASKKLARAASFGRHQVSHHTTRAWLSGERMPCADSILILAARCEDLSASLRAETERLREILSEK